MTNELYRYSFALDASAEDVAAALVLSLMAAESLHGEAQVRLDAAYHFETTARACVIDAGTVMGRDLNRLFAGFLMREFTADSFQVQRVDACPASATKEEAV